MSKVWLITGSGSGLGRIIAEAALEAGNKVVATARDPSQLGDLATRYGKQVLAIKLDVTDEEEGKLAVKAAVETFGRLDVLVNNAGYGDTRPFEQVPSDEFRMLIETCLFGVINLTRAALPIMRAQRSGHIIQISSMGGRMGFGGNAAYITSKWGVGGFTEALAQETASFGVKVTALEPGGMRTNWISRAYGERPALLPEYEATIGKHIEQIAALVGHEQGDPVRVAEVVLKVADADKLPPHIVLGSNAFEAVRHVEQQRMAEADRWLAVSKYTDFGAEGSVPSLPVD